MKLLSTYNSEAAAYIDKGYLADNGIPTVVEEDAISSVFPAPDAGTSNICLYLINDEQFDKAKALLDHRPA